MKAQRTAFGEALVELGATRPRMLVIDPDVCTSTQTSLFRDAFPERFLEVGIAEANAVGMAAGLATAGFEPWVSAFAVFLATRACDQVRVCVAHTRLPVRLNGSYGGLPTGRAGATHSAIEDIAIMRAMPNMTVLTPADATEARAMTLLASGLPGPVYIRTMRCALPDIFGPGHLPAIGTSVELRPGSDIALLAEGMMSARALDAAALLAAQGISARVVHFGTVKPIDKDAIERASRDCGALVTVENHSSVGGFGSAVCEVLAERAPCRAVRLGFPDIFLESGDDEAIFSRHGLDAAGIASAARGLLAVAGSRGRPREGA